MFAWSCAPHAAGQWESSIRICGNLQDCSRTSVKQTSKVLLLPETRTSYSKLQDTDFLHADMDHTQSLSDAEDRAPLLMPESFTRRQRLRAIAAGGENLYEPPNTAEAFARLEAAIDEVKFHGSMSEGQGLIARRQHLKAMVATYKDLYEPPDTAEAFARLEAAFDEVKRHASASESNSGQGQMLDPPTTVARFKRIGIATDEMLASTNVATGTPRQAKRSASHPHMSSTQGACTDYNKGAHRLRKSQLQFADQSESTQSFPSTDTPTKARKPPSLTRRPHGIFSRRGLSRPVIFEPSSACNPRPGKADTTAQSALELPISSEAKGTEPNYDVDVFRDDDSVKAFANQTYQSVREKYL